MTRTLTLVLSLLAFSATGAAAQTWRDYIQNSIYRDTRAWRDAGYSSGTVRTATLYDGDGTDLYYTLAAGVSYRFVGECDSKCYDLDLELYDGSGNLIDSDVEDDDTPVVSVTPRWTGQFRVHVHMADCGNDYCGYGVGVYIR